MIVADTCLIVHLFNETAHTETAQEILDKDSNWIIPQLWREEYANVLSKLARKEHQSIEVTIHHFSNTVNELKNCEINVDTQEALRISITYQISVYDAHFVALAMDFKTLLVTEDQEILKKCPNIAINMNNFLSRNYH